MQSLIEFLYFQNISSQQFLDGQQQENFKNIVKSLSKCQPIPIVSLPRTKTSSILNMLTPLFIRNMAHYDASTIRVNLIRSNILAFQRIAKIKKAIYTIHNDKHSVQAINKWIENGMFPFHINKAEKGLQKSVDALIESGVIYEDYSIDKKQHYMFKIEQLNKVMVQIAIADELKMTYKQFSGLSAQKKAKMSAEKQREKLDQYLIQCFGKDCLLAFRTVQSFKFISQKQLITKTLMDTVQLRKSLNKLIQNGIISFYSQNARTTIYSAISEQKLTKRYIDVISQSILNLQVVLASQQSSLQTGKSKMLKLQSAIIQLDNLLLLFQI